MLSLKQREQVISYNSNLNVNNIKNFKPKEFILCPSFNEPPITFNQLKIKELSQKQQEQINNYSFRYK